MVDEDDATIGSGVVAAAVCLLGDYAQLDAIAAVVGASTEGVGAQLAALEHAGEVSGATPVELAGPAAREAALSALPAARRALMEGAVAVEKRRRGAPIAEVCGHLLRAPGAGDADNVITLRRCAGERMEEGRPGEACACLRRALLEPPAEGRRSEVLVELADALLACGLPDEALIEARSARDYAQGRAQRAAAAASVYRALVAAGEVDQAIGVLTGEIERQRHEDPALALHLECALVGRAGVHERILRVALARFAEHGVDESLPDAGAYLLAIGQIQGMGGEASAAQAVRLTRRALELGWVGSEGETEALVRCAWLLIRADRPRDARAVLQLLRAKAPAHRDEPVADVFDGLIELRTGSVDDAIGILDGALTRALRRNGHDGLAAPAARAFLALALHEADEQRRLEALLEDIRTLPPSADSSWTAILRVVRGRHALRVGRAEDALRDFISVEEQKTALGMTNPAGYHQAEGAVVALVRLGRLSEAHELAALNLSRARDWGAPRTVALACRAQACCLPPRRAVPQLQDALGSLRLSQYRLTRARLQIDLARAQKEMNRTREAEHTLRSALDDATRIGALRVVRLARKELGLLGRNPRRPFSHGVEALTPAELRAGRLAAAGRRNREIAALLHLSVRTVENQLRSVYQKLGTDRAGLRNRLGGAPGR